MSRILAAGMIVLFCLGACSSNDTTAEDTASATGGVENTANATDSADADSTDAAENNATEGEYDDLDSLLAAAEENGFTCESAEDTELGEARAAVKCADGTTLGSFWNVGFTTIAVRDSEAADDTPVLYGNTWAIIGSPATDLQEGLGGELKNKSEF